MKFKDPKTGEVKQEASSLQDIASSEASNTETSPPCKWCHDEFCTNPDSPMRADYCPVPDTPFVCRHEDREEAEP